MVMKGRLEVLIAGDVRIIRSIREREGTHLEWRKRERVSFGGVETSLLGL
jgi:hypothetical protein